MLNPVDTDFIAALERDLPAEAVRPVTPGYLEEPRGAFQGTAGVVVTPGNVEDVATAVRLANQAQVPVVPIAGGTGLVAGQVFPDGPLPMLLSVERMSAIRSVHPSENVLVAEAGAILANVQAAAQEADRLFPLSLASEGSARIGGLLGTNAGGVNVLRYGNARDLCLGLEAVMPDGQIWHGLKRLRKDNTGYDLRNLLIGAEGTLGVITAASLRLYPQPSQTAAAMMSVRDPAGALKLLSRAKQRLGDGITAFELIAGQGLAFLAKTMPQVRLPMDPSHEWLVLIDLGLTQSMNAQNALEELFADAFEAGLVSDGLIAQSETQRQEFWNVRENIPIANKLVGAISSQDISLPLSALPDFIETAYGAINARGSYRINCFGHLGDGNLHFNIFPADGATKADHKGEKPEIQKLLHDLVHQMDGSFSAEHGVGRLKVDDLERYGDPTKLAAMRAIKTALDPNGIMNPGAVLRYSISRFT